MIQTSVKKNYTSLNVQEVMNLFRILLPIILYLNSKTTKTIINVYHYYCIMNLG